MGNHSKKTSQIRLGIDYRSPDTVCLPTPKMTPQLVVREITKKNAYQISGKCSYFPKLSVGCFRGIQGTAEAKVAPGWCGYVRWVCLGFRCAGCRPRGGGALGSTKLGKHTVGYPIWIIINDFYILSQFKGPIWWKIRLKTIWDKMKMQFLILRLKMGNVTCCRLVTGNRGL